VSDQERESRKRKLKERVIPGELEKKEREEQPEKAGERIALPRHFLLPLLFLLLLTLGLLFFFYNRRRYSRLTSKWSVDFSEKGESSGEYYSFSEGIVKVSKDGASYLSSSGKVLWNQAYEMAAPLVSINGDYMVIGEENGSKLFILSTEGLKGQGESSLPILKLSISEKGVVYALLADGESSYITVFSKEGKNLDISIKSVLGGDGFPMDFSTSKDGEELLVAFSYLEQSVLKSRGRAA